MTPLVPHASESHCFKGGELCLDHFDAETLTTYGSEPSGRFAAAVVAPLVSQTLLLRASG